MNGLNELVVGQIGDGGLNGASTRIQGSTEKPPLVVFVRHLWEMATDGVIVHWHRTGLAIFVNVRQYEANVLRLYPTHNRTNKFSLFHHQLTCHGFIRLTRDQLDDCLATDPRLAVYFHGCFRRDKPDLLWKIRNLRRMETGDRPNTQYSCLARHGRQTVGFVPLKNTGRTADRGPGHGEVPGRQVGVIPHITENGHIRHRGRSTSQPSARGQHAFADGPRRKFARRRARPCAARRRRTAPVGSRQQASHVIPIARLPDIIFVPHLVTVNGLIPLEPCYDGWKNASLQTQRTLRPWTKRGPSRDRQVDGAYMLHHLNFPACPHPTNVSQDITPSMARCDVTAHFKGGSEKVMPRRANNACCGDNSVPGWYRTNDDHSPATNGAPQSMRLPIKRCPNFDIDEPSERKENYDYDDDVDMKDGCVETLAKIEVTRSVSEPVFDPAPVSVWQRPPSGLDPFVILDKLPL